MSPLRDTVILVKVSIGINSFFDFLHICAIIRRQGAYIIIFDSFCAPNLFIMEVSYVQVQNDFLWSRAQ